MYQCMCAKAVWSHPVTMVSKVSKWLGEKLNLFILEPPNECSHVQLARVPPLVSFRHRAELLVLCRGQKCSWSWLWRTQTFDPHLCVLQPQQRGKLMTSRDLLRQRQLRVGAEGSVIFCVCAFTCFPPVPPNSSLSIYVIRRPR